MSVRLVPFGAGAALLALQPAFAASEGASCKAKDPAAFEAWQGVWAVEGIDAADQGLSGRSGQADYKLIGLNAPWNDEGWGRMAAVLREASKGNIKQGGWGFPMMMDSFSEFTFVISPSQTAIINQYREVRSIYTDGRGHVPEEDAWATNWGDSTGCWEGDTLVVDTVSVRFDPAFNYAAPPLSEQAHFVERIRMVAPDRMEDVMTITDPLYLEKPWTVSLTFIPAGLDRLTLDAYDDRNDTEAQTITSSTRTEFTGVPLPSGITLSHTQLDAVAGTYTLDGTPLEVVFERHDERLYLKPPGADVWIPMFAKGPQNFVSLDGGDVNFTLDANGKVAGFTGKSPTGEPTTATRKAP
ncbi:hypothetical protein GRI89_05435 [Altererythrobacter salegens]|uniref:Uncharacterized protein n=1 Tax=Croceibacterium salegens TaxID=1737568 RepID=A0A6I4SU88_9SPHN|nr:hypothetical protein [Croceibacterium salegens]MXO58978.1 hypothetical protein [Croceibacterium salegens]